MVNSKAKGGQAEREVMALLKEWHPGEWRRKPFCQKGSDLITPETFPWSVEVKNDKQLHLGHLWKPTRFLQACWEQTIEQAFDDNKKPLLIMKIEGSWFAATVLDGKYNTAYNLVNFDGKPVIIRTLQDFIWVYSDV